MPITMDGMASGMNTNAIIDKLMEVEARPIQKLQEDKKKNEIRKDALKLLSKQLNDLSSKTNELYGFRASYNDKLAESSNTSILEAIGSKSADNGINKVEIVEMASTHKIATDTTAEKEELPSGKFTIEVNGESINVNFKGGTILSLKEKIDEAASDFVSTSYMKISEGNYIFTLESKVHGKKGEIKIYGDTDLLKKAGLVNGKAKDIDKDRVEIVFDGRYFTSYMGEKKVENQNGSVDVGKDGKSFKVKGLLWQEYLLPIQAMIKDDSMLEFDFTYSKTKEEDDEALPYRVEVGPEEKINIKGIVLKGYNVSRIRPLKKRDSRQIDSLLGIGIISEDKGKRIEKIYPIDKDSKGKQEIPIGKDFKDRAVSKIIFYCNDGDAVFMNTLLSTPVKKKDDQLVPKNVIAKAENAKLKINGITIEREKNTDINDAIKGVSLNLKKTSGSETVSVKVDSDVEKSLKKIKEFVEAYNTYLGFNKDLIKADKIEKPLKDGDKRPLRGMFVGDMVIIRLDNTLKKVMGSSYSSNAAKQIKFLSEIGISTGKINASWDTIKEGKLIIDEQVLKEVIRDNPEGVSMFFGHDTDGDTKTDSGMAFEMTRTLKPYISFGKNIIASKIELEDESIKISNERIEKIEKHLKSYQAKLKQKFGSMEKAMSGAKNQRNWMNNNFGNNQGGNSK